MGVWDLNGLKINFEGPVQQWYFNIVYEWVGGDMLDPEFIEETPM